MIRFWSKTVSRMMQFWVEVGPFIVQGPAVGAWTLVHCVVAHELDPRPLAPPTLEPGDRQPELPARGAGVGHVVLAEEAEMEGGSAPAPGGWGTWHGVPSSQNGGIDSAGFVLFLLPSHSMIVASWTDQNDADGS